MISGIAEELKAERVEMLDLRRKTIVCDYFIVCSGTSDIHVRSIAEKVEEKMRAIRVKPVRVEGRGSGWILIDFGDVVCHVMREEQRQFYDLESLWKEVPIRDDIQQPHGQSAD
ncbi:MAG: ribosome silencing factor [Armatimonadota bacterium]